MNKMQIPDISVSGKKSIRKNPSDEYVLGETKSLIQIGPGFSLKKGR
jgi:hypothetical protein